MAHSMASSLSASLPQHHCQRNGSKRHRRLFEVIVRGFESLARRNHYHHYWTDGGAASARQSAAIDGRGAGYVVWVPRREQHLQQNPDSWNEETDDVAEGGRHVVLYGGGYEGLFAVRKGVCMYVYSFIYLGISKSTNGRPMCVGGEQQLFVKQLSVVLCVFFTLVTSSVPWFSDADCLVDEYRGGVRCR